MCFSLNTVAYLRISTVSGKLCKHQQWCVSLFTVTTLKTALTPDSVLRNTFFKLACGKDAPPGFLNAGVVATHAERPDSSASLVSFEIDETNAPSSSLDFDPDELKVRLQEFVDQLNAKIDRDPACFGAAADTFLRNKEKFARSDSNLVAGLVMAFKPASTQLSRKAGSLIKVQPTSISRRKFRNGGSRPALVGRKALNPALKLLKNAKRGKRTRRAHSLKSVVFQNKRSLPSMRRNLK